MNIFDYKVLIRLAWMILAAGFYVFLGFLGVQPHVPVPWDKLVHVAFASMVVMLMVRGIGIPIWRAAMGMFFFGAVDEVSQMLMPGRSADIRDLLADVIGACLGVTVITAWRALRSAEGRV